MTFRLKGKRVWIAGDRGMVGSAIVRRLRREDCEVVTAPRALLDLRDQSQVRHWMKDAKPQVVFLAAARVGGILANATYPAEFLYDNLMIEANVVETAASQGIEKLVFLGSSCIYPKFASQPISEDALMTGALEPSNEAYAVAKIAGIKLCQAYHRQYGAPMISAMPANLYGPGDNFDLESSHVVPALIRKADLAKRVGAASFTIWGSGTPLREFLHVDDCADAVVHLAKVYSDDGHVNVGSGEEITIRQLARLVADVVGFEGNVLLDPSKPDGTPRKFLDSGKLAGLGWRPSIALQDGLVGTYRWYLKQVVEGGDMRAPVRMKDVQGQLPS